MQNTTVVKSPSYGRTFVSSLALGALLLITAAQAPSAVSTHGSLSTNQVKELVANAKTPADHMKLSRHYAAMADMHEAEATEHEALAAEYEHSPALAASKHPMAPNTAEHCKFYAQHCREAAKEMRAMSAAHEQMAKDMR